MNIKASTTKPAAAGATPKVSVSAAAEGKFLKPRCITCGDFGVVFNESLLEGGYCPLSREEIPPCRCRSGSKWRQNAKVEAEWERAAKVDPSNYPESIFLDHAHFVYRAIDRVLEGYQFGKPQYIYLSKLQLIAGRRLLRDIRLGLLKGKNTPSNHVHRDMRTDLKRFIGAAVKNFGSPVDLTPFIPLWRMERELTGARPEIDIVKLDLPSISQEAIRRIDAAHIEARHLLQSSAGAYDREAVKGMPLEARAKQMFCAFARTLAEAQAFEYFNVTGKDGANRWAEHICDLVVSEVSKNGIHIGGDFRFYPDLDTGGREDLWSIAEATICDVINGTGLRDGMSRLEKLAWYKKRNGGKKYQKLHEKFGTDRWSFNDWQNGLLPDGSVISKRIEAGLRGDGSAPIEDQAKKPRRPRKDIQPAFVYLMSLNNPEKRTTGGTICQAPKQLATRAIAEGTHRVCTAEEARSYLGKPRK